MFPSKRKNQRKLFKKKKSVTVVKNLSLVTAVVGIKNQVAMLIKKLKPKNMNMSMRKNTSKNMRRNRLAERKKILVPC